MPRPALLRVCCLSVVAACGGEAKKPPQEVPPDTVVDMVVCTVSLTRKDVPKYVGTGSHADTAKATELAWTDACAKLPEATRPGCLDRGKFTPEIRGSDPMTVTLTPVTAKISGRSEALPSQDVACAEAQRLACERSGVQGDCVASGAYVANVDEVERKKTVLSAPQ